MHTPKPHRGWSPEGTATWQRAEAARRALLAYIRHGDGCHCIACDGQGWIACTTTRGERWPDEVKVRTWLLPVVCPHCRPEDHAR